MRGSVRKTAAKKNAAKKPADKKAVFKINADENSALRARFKKRDLKRTKQLKQAHDSLAAEILDRKTAEESLKQLTKHLVTSLENERQRVARDLHDGINQLLSVAKRRMVSAETLLGGKIQRPALNDITQAKKILEKAISEVKKVSHNLMPSVLADLGLVSAVRSMTEEFSSATKIYVELMLENADRRFSPETELHTYRIIQESLHNIQKHSKANYACIILKYKEPVLTILIKDDGSGFNQIEETLKYGLLGMKERAELLGGTFEVVSKKGTGTKIKAVLPHS